MNVQRIRNAPICVQTLLALIGVAAGLGTNSHWMHFLAQVLKRLYVQ